MAIGQRNISDRQSIMIQYINLTTIDIERIGDHIEKMIEITDLRLKRRVWFEKDHVNDLKELFAALDIIFINAKESLNPDKTTCGAAKINIIKSIESYKTLSSDILKKHFEQIKNYTKPPMSAYFYSEYILSLDRIVKHLRRIADIECQDIYFINSDKLNGAV